MFNDFLSRCFICRVDGGGRKLKTIGMRISDIRNVSITLMDAIIPNSMSTSLCVKENTKKPMAVVTLAKKVDTPMR